MLQACLGNGSFVRIFAKHSQRVVQVIPNSCWQRKCTLAVLTVHALVDATHSYTGLGSERMKPTNGRLGPAVERRKRPRAALRWTVLVTRGSSRHPMETTTINV